MSDLSNNPSKSNNAAPRTVATFAGPLPPPNILAQYEHLQAGLADRIVCMAEKQGDHRRALEAKELNARIQHMNSRNWEAKLGQFFAFILTLITIVVGGYLVIYGYQVTGTIFGGMGLGAIIVAFIYGTKKENK